LNRSDDKLEPGDRVKLTPVVAKTFANRRHARIKWQARRGTFRYKAEFTGQCAVQWDGTNFIDFWPCQALERAEQPAPT